jgi:Amt family ammonium transporter
MASAALSGRSGTGIFTAPGLGGTGAEDFSIAAQTWTQILAVLVTVAWCAVGSFIAFTIVKAWSGCGRVRTPSASASTSTSHGEAAYHGA